MDSFFSWVVVVLDGIISYKIPYGAANYLLFVFQPIVFGLSVFLTRRVFVGVAGFSVRGCWCFELNECCCRFLLQCVISPLASSSGFSAHEGLASVSHFIDEYTQY